MGQESILEVSGLSVVFYGEEDLRDVSSVVPKSEVGAILGPNGAGKSVLLKTLVGLLPYRGKIVWSKDAKIGYVPQRFQVEKSLPLTVREFFLLHAAKFIFARGEMENKIQESLRMVQVAESSIDERLGTLSGGQLQRVLIAWALFDKPNVLLFDEPTAGIDATGEQTIYNLLHELQDRFGITIILVSHELNIVYRYATSVICLNRSLVCSGAPREVLTPEALAQLYCEPAYYHHAHDAAEIAKSV